MPLWISHRGLCKGVTENTTASFDAAVAAGFTALETDLRLTRDGRIVLAHDEDLRRVAGLDVSWASLSSDEAARVRYRRGELPLFFDDFVERYATCRWTLDLKTPDAPGTILALVKRPDAARIVENTTFLCWRASDEALLRASFPTARFYAREEECRRAGLAALTAGGFGGGIRAGRTYALTPSLHGISLFRTSIVSRYHSRGATVIAFLPDTEAEAHAAVAAGFDEILTNHPIL